MPGEIVQPKIFVRTFVALLLFLALTVGANFLNLGALNVAVAMLISVAKAALIVLLFMEVRYSRPIIWLFAAAGFLWLIFMIALILSDYQTRSWSGQEWRSGTNGQRDVPFARP